VSCEVCVSAARALIGVNGELIWKSVNARRGHEENESGHRPASQGYTTWNLGWAAMTPR